MFDRKLLARKPAALIAPLLVMGLIVMMPTAAQAGFSGLAEPKLPDIPLGGFVVVGQTGLASSLRLQNTNGPPQDVVANLVCNLGDPLPCFTGYQGITLTPSCGLVGLSTVCDPGGYEPGIFKVSGTGTGDPASGCPNMPFAIDEFHAPSGRLRVTPLPSSPGTHVQLAGPTPNAAAASCLIKFTVDVLKVPTIDEDAAKPGIQTLALATSVQRESGGGGGVAEANGSSPGVTIKAQPAITTIASPDAALPAGQLSDQATVTGLFNPVAGATVTFRLYPPAQSACTGTPVYTSDVPVALSSGTTATATSGSYTPTVAGAYHWVATYNGDATNNVIAGACNEATETRTVSSPVCTPYPGPAPAGGTVCAKKADEICTTPPGPAPAGGKLCARGVAAINGKTGCQGTPFRVVVRGSQISTVLFTLDGKKVRRLTKPNSGSLYVLNVNPRRLKSGVHRVLARTIFRKQSGTKNRTLRTTFSRCSRRAQAPAFTG